MNIFSYRLNSVRILYTPQEGMQFLLIEIASFKYKHAKNVKMSMIKCKIKISCNLHSYNIQP